MHSVTTILKLFLLQLNSILFRYFSNVLCLILVWDLLIIEKYSYVFFLLLSCFVFVNFILLQGAGLNYSQYTVHRNCELISETTCEFDFESAEWDGKCGCLMFGLDLCWFFSFGFCFVSFVFFLLSLVACLIMKKICWKSIEEIHNHSNYCHGNVCMCVQRPFRTSNIFRRWSTEVLPIVIVFQMIFNRLNGNFWGENKHSFRENWK